MAQRHGKVASERRDFLAFGEFQLFTLPRNQAFQVFTISYAGRSFQLSLEASNILLGNPVQL
jgi:hypothetical protein